MDTSHLIALTDKVATRFLARLEGLTDDEYRWEPAPVVWNVRDDGRWEFALMPEDPVPVTTIAWRLVHIIDLLTEERCYRQLDIPLPPDGQQLRIPMTAVEAVDDLQQAFAIWRGLLETTDSTRLDESGTGGYTMGGQFRPFSDRTTFALHILDEVIHHTAEVSLLRDLYSAQSIDPLKASALNGEIDPATVGELEARHHDLVAEAAGAGFWIATARLIDAGFDVNAKRAATALHHAAGMGRADLVQRLLDSGADRDVVDDVYRATPILWAQTMSKRLGGPNAIGADWASVIEMLSVPQDRPRETET